jgi:hypothetical protein
MKTFVLLFFFGILWSGASAQVPIGDCKMCYRFQISLGVSLLLSCLNLAGGAIKRSENIFFCSSPGES